MRNIIELKEGFSFVYEENNKKINLQSLSLDGYRIANNWMETTDFVAILESALKNRLGTVNQYKVGQVTIFGTYSKNYIIHLIALDSTIATFDLIQTQQIVSKLNKLLHMVNKLYYN